MDFSSYYSRLLKRNKLRYFIRKYFVNDLAKEFEGFVLDAGCGIGEFLGRYKSSVGLDVNPYSVSYCRSQGYNALVGDATNLPFADNLFDGVLVSNVLEHLTFAEKCGHEVARVLRPNGKFVITLPMEAGFRGDPTHVRMFYPRDVHAFAENCNFHVQKMYYFPFMSKIFGNILYFYELRAVLIRNN